MLYDGELRTLQYRVIGLAGEKWAEGLGRSYFWSGYSWNIFRNALHYMIVLLV